MLSPSQRDPIRATHGLITAEISATGNPLHATIEFSPSLGGVRVVASGLPAAARKELMDALNYLGQFPREPAGYLNSALLAFDVLRPLTRSSAMKEGRVQLPHGTFNALQDALDREIESAGPAGMHFYFSAYEITSRIIELHSISRALACHAFLRPQEFIDGQKYRGNPSFTRAEFRDWYAEEGGPLANVRDSHGRPYREFSYCADWSGFNFPRSAAELLCNGSFTHLTASEKYLANIFSPLMQRGEFYIIGSTGDRLHPTSIEIRQHEIRHGLFATDSDYRQRMREILASEEAKALLPALHLYFKTDGCYHQEVWEDEAQAHLGNSGEMLTARGINFTPEELLTHAKVRERVLKLMNERLDALRPSQ